MLSYNYLSRKSFTPIFPSESNDVLSHEDLDRSPLVYFLVVGLRTLLFTLKVV